MFYLSFYTHKQHISLTFLWCSSRLDHGIKQIRNGNVVSQNLTPHRLHFALLLTNTLFKLGKLVLQRVDQLLRYFLLFLEAVSALDRFSPPVLILLAHRVHVVGHVVYWLSKRICWLAENLNCFFHEFNVLLWKPATWIRGLHCLQSSHLLLVLVGLLAFFLCSWLGRNLLLLSNTAHLDLVRWRWAVLLRGGFFFLFFRH